MNKNFWLLTISQATINLADTLYIISLVTLIFNKTGQATYTALIPFSVTLALFVGGIFCVALFPLFSFKRLLFISQLCKNIALFLIILFMDHLTQENIWVIFILIIVNSLFDSIANPIRNSIIPLIVDNVKIHKANSITASLDQFIRLGSWSLGGIFLSLTSYFFILIVSLILYIISTFLIIFLNTKETKVAQKESPHKFSSSVKEGWLLILRIPKLKAISFINLVEGFANGVWIAAIIYIYVDQQLQLGKEWWGYINSIFFCGMLLGSMLSTHFSNLIQRKMTYCISISSLLLGIITFVFGNVTIGFIALILSLSYGVLEQIKDICINTLIQQHKDTEQLPKIYSAQSVISTISFGCSTIFLGFLTDIFGITITFEFASILFFLSFIISLKYWHKLKMPSHS
ncbi:hypothetical protein CN354_24360 [Bacillus cereus]|nr:hypothetical protein CN354_24360 [Bacillus cereus]WJE53087.1 MFS transporter [Bacillus cereus]